MQLSTMPFLRDKALVAALALVIIQVGVGVVYKMAAQGNNNSRYTFSPSSSVTISEFMKGVLSCIFFWLECRRRLNSKPQYKPVTTDSDEASLTEKEDSESSYRGSESDDELLRLKEMEEHAGSFMPHAEDGNLTIGTFIAMIQDEVPKHAKYGYMKLALLYCFLNNTIYISYRMADPGTIQLLKSLAILITAIVMLCTLGTRLVRAQWLAIIFQVCGLFVTQYRPSTGLTYSLATYLLLFAQTIVSACAGVYNTNLNKSQNASLHVDNMILYSFGSAVNLMVHIVTRMVVNNEPGFFAGYDTPNAIMVLISNVFIGLAVTAVYKYANAIIKCLATAISTGVLLYLSPILFGSPMSLLSLPGTVIVFGSTFLYSSSTPPKEAQTENEPPFGDIVGKLSSLLPIKFIRKQMSIAVCTAATVALISGLFVISSEPSSQAVAAPKTTIDPVKALETPLSKGNITSPFKNTLGMIRVNIAELDHRIPSLMNYEPFFHDLHISIPERNGDTYVNNLTYDNAGGCCDTYVNVGDTMADILSAPADDPRSEIEGILYFHFDFWVDPLAFANEDFNNTWVLAKAGPDFQCMTDLSQYRIQWWRGVEREWHKAALEANLELSKSDYGLKADPTEFCFGWADFYYIPRRMFADWIIASRVYQKAGADHEVAVASIMRVLELTHRPHKHISTISQIGDCYGSCCTPGGSPRDILETRCGHHLDWTQEASVQTQLDRLKSEEKLLGKALDRVDEEPRNGTRIMNEVRRGDKQRVWSRGAQTHTEDETPWDDEEAWEEAKRGETT